MIFSNTQKASRPVAAVLAMAFVAAFWLPTVSSPANAADTSAPAALAPSASDHDRIVIAAPFAPALM